VFFVLEDIANATRVEGGAVLWEQNALPYEERIAINLTAKDDVDNVGAGRAAKGATLVACSIIGDIIYCTKPKPPSLSGV
jgi:hypothetical protein